MLAKKTGRHLRPPCQVSGTQRDLFEVAPIGGNAPGSVLRGALRCIHFTTRSIVCPVSSFTLMYDSSHSHWFLTYQSVPSSAATSLYVAGSAASRAAALSWQITLLRAWPS